MRQGIGSKAPLPNAGSYSLRNTIEGPRSIFPTGVRIAAPA
jgi:hypothetical protein